MQFKCLNGCAWSCDPTISSILSNIMLQPRKKMSAMKNKTVDKKTFHS